VKLAKLIDIKLAAMHRPRLFSRYNSPRSIIESLLLILAIYTVFNLTTARYVVVGASMEPSFHSGELIIVNRAAYLFGSPARGDVIIFHNPSDPAEDYIKRVIGLPGETVRIQDGRVYVNQLELDEPYIREFCANHQCDGTWQLDHEHYFVLGDNRNHSRDGHIFGPLWRGLIVGQAWVRFWPLSQLTLILYHDDQTLRNWLPA
jgi:signal peptidase I